MTDNLEELHSLSQVYERGLQETLDFWIKNSIDHEYGGYLFHLDRSGDVIGDRKPMWIHGRFVWLLSTFYSEVEASEGYLSLASHGLEFIKKYGFDTDERAFFMLNRDGSPIRKRRYFFTECFHIMGMAAYSRAVGDKQLASQALDLFRKVWKWYSDGIKSKPKTIDNDARGVSMPMILIGTSQILRQVSDAADLTECIDFYIGEIQDCFLSEKYKALLETVSSSGELIDSFEGRMLNPGHAIEIAWFILQEGKSRQKDEYVSLGLKILDWMWQWGWDDEYGGIIYNRDVKGLPCSEYWHDMKFWWPQNEGLIATLLAYQLTEDNKYLDRHRQLHDWAYSRFPDPEYGEWYGYLHRDGRVSTNLKGNDWKGPFHLPRMQLKCQQIIKELTANGYA